MQIHTHRNKNEIKDIKNLSTESAKLRCYKKKNLNDLSVKSKILGLTDKVESKQQNSPQTPHNK